MAHLHRRVEVAVAQEEIIGVPEAGPDVGMADGGVIRIEVFGDLHWTSNSWKAPLVFPAEIPGERITRMTPVEYAVRHEGDRRRSKPWTVMDPASPDGR
jgi:hypothetical protein